MSEDKNYVCIDTENVSDLSAIKTFVSEFPSTLVGDFIRFDATNKGDVDESIWFKEEEISATIFKLKNLPSVFQELDKIKSVILILKSPIKIVLQPCEYFPHFVVLKGFYVFLIFVF